MIEPFKLQRAIVGEPSVLIYNEDRSIMSQLPMTDDLLRLFGREDTVYVMASVYKGNLEIEGLAPEDVWF